MNINLWNIDLLYTCTGVNHMHKGICYIARLSLDKMTSVIG